VNIQVGTQLGLGELVTIQDGLLLVSPFVGCCIRSGQGLPAQVDKERSSSFVVYFNSFDYGFHSNMKSKFRT